MTSYAQHHRSMIEKCTKEAMATPFKEMRIFQNGQLLGAFSGEPGHDWIPISHEVIDASQKRINVSRQVAYIVRDVSYKR